MKIVTTILLAGALCTGTLYAKKPEHAGKEKHKKHQKNRYTKNNFSSNEKWRVYSYYKTLPQGLVKKLKRGGELPPGWQKKVSVGKPIPYEYLEYAKPVPDKLESQLTAGPIGSKVLQIADRIIRIEAGTNIVLDAIRF